MIDRDLDGTVGVGDEKVHISWIAGNDGITGIVEKITFEDKSYWQLKDKNTMEYEGFIPRAKEGRFDRLELRESVGGNDAVQQKNMIDTQHQLYSPKQIGRAADLNVPIEDIEDYGRVIETPHGSWHNPGTPKEYGLQSSGERLVMGSDGGVQGVLQQQIHANNPQLDPDAVGIIAHRAALDPTNGLNFHTNVVFAERFLLEHSDWWKDSQGNRIHLSPKERYEVGKLAAPHWVDWDDDDEIKAGLLSIIPTVEAAYD